MELANVEVQASIFNLVTPVIDKKRFGKLFDSTPPSPPATSSSSSGDRGGHGRSDGLSGSRVISQIFSLGDVDTSDGQGHGDHGYKLVIDLIDASVWACRTHDRVILLRVKSQSQSDLTTTPTPTPTPTPTTASASDFDQEHHHQHLLFELERILQIETSPPQLLDSILIIGGSSPGLVGSVIASVQATFETRQSWTPRLSEFDDLSTGLTDVQVNDGVNGEQGGGGTSRCVRRGMLDWFEANCQDLVSSGQIDPLHLARSSCPPFLILQRVIPYLVGDMYSHVDHLLANSQSWQHRSKALGLDLNHDSLVRLLPHGSPSPPLPAGKPHDRMLNDDIINAYFDLLQRQPRSWSHPSPRDDDEDVQGGKEGERKRRRRNEGKRQKRSIRCLSTFACTIMVSQFEKERPSVLSDDGGQPGREAALIGPSEGLVNMWKSNWLKGDPTDYSIIISPVHVRGKHWTLVVCHPRSRRLAIYDPMGEAVQVDDDVANEIWKAVRVLTFLSFPRGGRYIWCQILQPLQPNAIDCGTYIIAAARILSIVHPANTQLDDVDVLSRHSSDWGDCDVMRRCIAWDLARGRIGSWPGDTDLEDAEGR